MLSSLSVIVFLMELSQPKRHSMHLATARTLHGCRKLDNLWSHKFIFFAFYPLQKRIISAFLQSNYAVTNNTFDLKHLFAQMQAYA